MLQDTPGKLDHEYVCAKVLNTDDAALSRERILLNGSYRTLEILAMPFELNVNGNGVIFVEGKRYRVTIEEMP